MKSQLQFGLKHLGFLLTFTVGSSALAADTYTIMSYNVENLFDTVHDDGKNDVEFTPDGSAKWTLQRMNQKLDHLTELIRNSTPDRQGPDVILLSEVEKISMIRLLGNRLPKNYRAILVESEDPRGIDTAILTTVPAKLVDAHHVVMEKVSDEPSEPLSLFSPLKFGDFSDLEFKSTVTLTTRRILEVDLNFDGHILKTIVNHWPSRMAGKEASEPKRIAAASVAASIVQDTLRRNPSADILLAGDFNDEPEDVSIRKILKARGDPYSVSEQLHAPATSGGYHLYNLVDQIVDLEAMYNAKTQNPKTFPTKMAAEIEERGTYYFGRDAQWNNLDQMIASPGLLDRRGLSVVSKSFHVVRLPFAQDERKAPKPYRITSKGTYIEGYSDHFPVMTTVRVH